MSLRFTTAGESHGPGLTVIVEGLPAGLELAGAGTASVCGAAHARTLLTTEDPDLAVDPAPVEIEVRGEHAEVRFRRPGAVILQSSIRG